MGITDRPVSSIKVGYSFVPCLGAAIFYDAKAPCRDLINDAVVEEYDAIADVFLQTVTCEMLVALFAGNYGCNFFGL